MIQTAPYVEPKTIHEETYIYTNNFDMEKINIFNSRISICTKCVNCFAHNNIPHCKELNTPIAAAANRETCIIGKW